MEPVEPREPVEPVEPAFTELAVPDPPEVEEDAGLRLMQALRAHATACGAPPPACAPWGPLLAPPAPRLDLAALRRAGFRVVPWTINEPVHMRALLALGVDGIISDAPDRLLEAVAAFEGGRLLGRDGLPDVALLETQGHRGARDLRPENTLPAIEAGLDHLVTTLEVDLAITRDGVPVVTHDTALSAATCRRADWLPYGAPEVLVRALDAEDVQRRFVADRVQPGRPRQAADLSLSPVAGGFADAGRIPHPYAIPTLQQLFAFTAYYEAWYRRGPGSWRPEAAARAAAAARVRFNLEIKTNPRREAAALTPGPTPFARIVGAAVLAAGLASRVQVQSFDLRPVLVVQREFPALATAALLGDFPTGEGGDGANLQDEDGAPSPWLAGFPWPYRRRRLPST